MGELQHAGRLRRTLRSGYRHATAKLPPAAAGAIDELFEPLRKWHGPMNGQSGRQQLTREIFATARPEAVVETGAFLGATTAFMAGLTQVPIHTVEAQERYYGVARRRLSRFAHVDITLGDSRELLARRADVGGATRGRTFFYLDAHWEEDLPLAEELDVISEHWPDALVMIDDFAVPDDPGYLWDDYGPGRALNEDYLPPLDGWLRAYPALPSARESGGRRGCVVLASPAAAEAVRSIASLRMAGDPIHQSRPISDQSRIPPWGLSK